MNNDAMRNPRRSATAALLAAVLVFSSPGLPAYQALAAGPMAKTAGRLASAQKYPGGFAGSTRGHDLRPGAGTSSLVPGLPQALPQPEAAWRVGGPAPNAEQAIEGGPGAIIPEDGAAASAAEQAGDVPIPEAAPARARLWSGLGNALLRLRKRVIPFSRPPTSAESRQLFDNDSRAVDDAALPADAGSAAGRPARAGLARYQAPAAAAKVETVPAPRAASEAARGFWSRPTARYGAAVGLLAAMGALLPGGILPAVAISGVLLGSILVHESAHILGLRIWGDPTPGRFGRDYLNPLRHIDPLGTLIVPALSMILSTAAFGFPLLLGWAKPVPVDFNKLADTKKDTAKIALLGPLSNVMLAGLAYGALALAGGGPAALALAAMWKMNLALAAFNMIPLPWLDGGKVAIGYLMPRRLYERWIFNPNLPQGYQSLFRRIYEGPANVLSRLRVERLGQINGLTRAATLAGLAAFSFVLGPVLGQPLWFLALPCNYEYQCIREKVRSEKAVAAMMRLQRRWGGSIAQLARADGRVASRVSAFEAETAMAAAADQLLGEMMEQESFRALSEQEKIDAFMKAYPERAARLLKERAFKAQEDTEETALRLFAAAGDEIDPETKETRLKSFERWLDEHHAFETMMDKHRAAEPQAEAAEEETNPRGMQAGSARLGLLLPLALAATGALLAHVFLGAGAADLAWAPGMAAMLGQITVAPAPPAAPELEYPKAEEPDIQAEALPAEGPARKDRSGWISFLNNSRDPVTGKKRLSEENVKVLSTNLKPIEVSGPPLVGRVKEIQRTLVHILSPQGMGSSAMLVGQPGVGKSAIAASIAQLSREGLDRM
ncbi:MAG: hypothetical protein PHF00_10685, partial [Elusimicrobia bacterium]|nr:hypothetical protein [Elusimicrobiota bacterium]